MAFMVALLLLSLLTALYVPRGHAIWLAAMPATALVIFVRWMEASEAWQTAPLWANGLGVLSVYAMCCAATWAFYGGRRLINSRRGT